ncbi:NYN domain-containing protein [Glaciihabitans arcticus]|uniref:NYN domain-containing protein n=1 Tax=Glaciihabitans arcticus TaxID=2668039 RepID=A0A4Q9GSU5_9MICO|nr:NYN domain-containing protein [Glaciihabitans arcticus]TBN57214.1 NYN domain-containing protein [Glaciihabitans arcticus]
MPESSEARVAVYIDFDNIVISRYAQVHPKNQRENLSRIDAIKLNDDAELGKRLESATVDIGAILDFATSFGSVVISRAYADWSAVVNARYRQQLINRAVDLVQLFPTSGQKNGADIRLAIDAVEDLFRLPDITHVVIVAGDSDYIALAQRSKRLGRRVIGIGVAGSTSESLAAACDEFADYDTLVDAEDEPEEEPKPILTTTEPVAKEPAAKKKAPQNAPDPKRAAGRLLRKSVQLLQDKEDGDWVLSTSVKNQMLRIDPTFSEKALGFKTFTDFVKDYNSIVERDDSTSIRKLRLRA